MDLQNAIKFYRTDDEIQFVSMVSTEQINDQVIVVHLRIGHMDLRFPTSPMNVELIKKQLLCVEEENLSEEEKEEVNA